MTKTKKRSPWAAPVWSGVKETNFRDALDDAKERLPLPELLDKFGDGLRAPGGSLCPFHHDHNPSFSVYLNPKGAWRWKCHAGCGGGDEIAYLEFKLHMSRPQAIRKYFQLAAQSPKSERGGE